MSRIRFEIDSELGAANLVALSTHALSLHAGFDEMRAYEIELCVTEAVTNVIRHAYQSQPGHAVSVSLKIGEDGLELEVGDRGAAMRAAHIGRLTCGGECDEDDGTQKDSLPEGGRGLQIIHDLMDEVGYFTDGDGNHLRMVKRLQRSTAADGT